MYMERLSGDNVIFEKRIMRSRLISQLYTAGVNYVPNIFLNQEEPYGKQISEFEVLISKERFFDVHYRIRDGIKNDLEFKRMITRNTYQVMNEFHDAVVDFEKTIREGSFCAEKMAQYIKKHSEVLALAEYNGCLPIEWYEKTICDILKQRTAYSLFGHTDFISHRQQFRNAKLLLAKEYIEKGSLSNEKKHEFWVQYYHLDSKIDHCMIYDENEENALIESIEVIKQNYSTQKIEEEVAFSEMSYRMATKRYTELLAHTEEVMREQQYSVDEIENYISALKIISLATTEEEYRHMQQDKFFRLMTYVFKVYNMCPVYTSIDMLLNTIESVPYEYVMDETILHRFV